MTFEEWLRSASLNNESAAVRSLMFHAWNAGSFHASMECAEICDARAMECERKVKPASADETANMRSLAWQFSVLAQQIRATIK